MGNLDPQLTPTDCMCLDCGRERNRTENMQTLHTKSGDGVELSAAVLPLVFIFTFVNDIKTKYSKMAQRKGFI